MNQRCDERFLGAEIKEAGDPANEEERRGREESVTTVSTFRVQEPDHNNKGLFDTNEKRRSFSQQDCPGCTCTSTFTYTLVLCSQICENYSQNNKHTHTD